LATGLAHHAIDGSRSGHDTVAVVADLRFVPTMWQFLTNGQAGSGINTVSCYLDEPTEVAKAPGLKLEKLVLTREEIASKYDSS